MAPPTLLAGDDGPAVLALQLALRRSLGKHAENKANGFYGSGTVRDVFRFEKSQKILPVSGRTCGPKTWQRLGHKGHLAAPRIQKLLKEAARLEKLEDKRTLSDQHRRLIIAEAFYGLAHNGRLVYRQVRPMAPSLHSSIANYRTDCSSFVTLCYKYGKAPDPNGFGYNGYGFTGTLVTRGEWVREYMAGDLAFYGYQAGGIPSHVAILINPREVISFGGEPGPRRLPVRYRSDLRGVKRYALV